MNKTKKYVALTGLASVLVWAIGSTGLAVDRSLLAVPKQVGGLGLSRQAEGRSDVTVLLSTREGQAGAVSRTVREMGGSVTTVLADADFVVAKVPTAALQDLERSSLVRALAVDRPIRLDPSAMQRLADAAPTPPSATDPALSLNVTRGEIRAPQLIEQTGNDGSGAVIAVLDTGVDAAHPALLRTPGGEVKITDWQDFTGEGDVETRETATEPIPAIPSKSGTYHVGVFTESQIPKGEMNSDINRNGKSDDQFRVVVTDAGQKGVYDTAYIDLDGDGNLSNERPMRVYNQSFDVGTFGPKETGVNFVVTRINPDGSGLNLGYDGGEHGTHVAGIAAGSGPITGIAPGARVMAIKVLSSGGSGSWSGIIQGMHYAATRGAHVINMSLGGIAELNDGNDPQSLFIKDLTARTGTIFSIAGGNSGPGLNTMGLPGVAGSAITSGAFISTNTWKVDYGLNVPQDGLWYFSSAGPRDDGGLKPNIVAPGTANSAVPTWAGQYAVFQGTSMAAPQTSGAAALLVGAARGKGLAYKPEHLRMALELSARRLPGYGWYEQGHGLIQVDAAWGLLQRVARESSPELVSLGRAKPGATGSGLYAREFPVLAGKDSEWLLVNREFRRAALDLSYLPGSGLTVTGPQSILMLGMQRKEIPLRYRHDQAPGVYDALIQARVQGQTSYAAEYLSTVVVPYEVDPIRGNTVSGIKGSLGPARYGRHFIRVPAGTAELTVNLTVPGSQGRVRVMAYTPDGMPAGASPWAGAPKEPERQTLTIQNPQPGVWEIDAYASHGAMNYGLIENRYVIDVAARGVYASPSKLDLPLSAGRNLSSEVTFVNDYGDLKAVTAGAGFAQPETQQLEVEHGSFKDFFFDVEEGTAMLRADVSRINDPAAELEVSVYYSDEKAGGWVPVGQRSQGRVDVLNPAPGKYAVEIVGKSVPSGKTGFRYNLVRVRGGGAILPQDQPAERAFGSIWTVPVNIKVPAGTGPYLGAITLRDERSGKVLTVVPVEVK